VELCFEIIQGEALERGNWSRCYGTNYYSQLFKQNLTYSVYLPPSYYENPNAKYPTVWLLHGRASSSTSYRDVDNIGAFMDEQIKSGNIMEMVLIMPDSGKYAFYEDSKLSGTDKDNTGPWRTQLTEELRAVAQEAYRIKKEAKFNGLTGNSMGGYGSIMAGTTRPDLYSSIGLHMAYLPGDALESLKALNEAQGLADYDFYLDCGLQDQTVGTAGTIAIHEYLESVDKAHGYDLRDGTHGSAFYMSGMGASMKMHSDHFKANGLLLAPAGGGGGGGFTANSSAVEKTENGSVTLSSKYAVEGKEITINVKPDEGYELKSVTVTDAKGNEIEVIEKNGVLSFVMPATKVTVKAEFVEADKVCASDKFSDLDAGAWYHDAVDYVLEQGIMTGVAEDKFAPAMALTRGMVVQMLWAMEGKPVVNYAMDFEDVASDAWYAEAVRWAVANGISTGYSAKTFGAADAVTREQMAVMLAGYARYKGIDVADGAEIDAYADAADVSSWAVAGLKWACGEGILSGKAGNKLDPAGTATRMEAAQMLMKFSAVLAD